MLSYLRNTLQLILAPSSGWEDVSVSSNDTDRMVKRYVFPMMGLAALSLFVRFFYESDMMIGVTIIRAVVIFVSLFISYFFAKVMADHFLYHFCDQEPSYHKISTVVAYAMALMAVATIISNVIPVHLGLSYLLPLGVALVVWRANVYLKVSEDKDLFYAFFMTAIAIVPPIVIQHLFDSII